MFQTVLFILFVVSAGVFFGILVGIVSSNLALQKGLMVIAKAFLRVTRKKWLRFTSPHINNIRIQRDQSYIALLGRKKIGAADVKAIEMVTELKQRLSVFFRNQIEALYLFGSRARGDYQLDSDVDVGIFLADAECSDQLKKELLYQTSELLLKYGLMMQIRIFDQNSSRNVFNRLNNYLARMIRSYGIRI